MLSKETLQAVIKAERRAVLVVNTRSRAGEELFSRSMELLASKGILLQEVHPVKNPEHLAGIVGEAVGQGSKLVIVGGGDGTLRSIVAKLAYRDVVLEILPLGTVNAFARTLGVPLDPPGAVEVIDETRVADVDLGLIDGDYFTNVASLYLSPQVARRISSGLKRRLGALAFALIGLRLLASKKPFRCRLHAAEADITVDSRQIVIANGRFFGVGVVGPGAHTDNRSLAVCNFEGKSRIEFLKSFGAFFLGRHVSLKETDYFFTRKLPLEADPKQWIDADGEIVGRTPATIAVAQQALKVLVPRDFVDIE